MQAFLASGSDPMLTNLKLIHSLFRCFSCKSLPSTNAKLIQTSPEPLFVLARCPVLCAASRQTSLSHFGCLRGKTLAPASSVIR